MRSDIERWEAKYRDANPNPAFAPDPILVEYARLLDRRGTALDVACGVGQNAIYLAERGYDAVALDGSLTGVRYGQEHARSRGVSVRFVVIDLDQYTPRANAFDLVLVVRYLNRALIPALKRSLKPNGLIIYKTFNVNYRKEHRTFQREYLLDPGELARLFEDFHCLATNDSPTLSESQTFWIGHR